MSRIWVARATPANPSPSFLIHAHISFRPIRNESHGKNNWNQPFRASRANERTSELKRFIILTITYSFILFALLLFPQRFSSLLQSLHLSTFLWCFRVCVWFFFLICQRIAFTTWHFHKFLFIFMSLFVSILARWDSVLDWVWSFRWNHDTFCISALFLAFVDSPVPFFMTYSVFTCSVSCLLECIHNRCFLPQFVHLVCYDGCNLLANRWIT